MVAMKKHPGFAYEMLSPIHYLRNALDIPTAIMKNGMAAVIHVD